MNSENNENSELNRISDTCLKIKGVKKEKNETENKIENSENILKENKDIDQLKAKIRGLEENLINKNNENEKLLQSNRNLKKKIKILIQGLKILIIKWLFKKQNINF